VIARRTAFLRQELLAQTRALRAGLFAAATQNTSATAPAQNPSALSSVARAVEAVAGEAKALARARIELDESDKFVPSLSPAPLAEVRLRQR
jgi:hypothetical protein